MNYKKTGTITGLLAALTLLAGTAFAGPTWQFGPENQGLLKLDYKGQFQLVSRDTGASPAGDERATEFNFRRNRLALMGAYGPNFGLYVQTEFREDNNIGTFGVSDGGNSDFQLLDAVLRFKANDKVNVWLGKFKYNFTRENLEACEAPLNLDRSALIRAPYVGTRDKGVAVWGNLLENKLQYRADIMNGRNDSASSPQSNLRYSVRAHVSLLEPESGYGYKGTYMGEKTVLTIGAAYQFESDVAFSDTVAQSGSVDYQAWTADLFFEYPDFDLGTFTFSAAYTDYDLDDAFKGANPDGGALNLSGEKNGGYVKLGYMLPDNPLQFFARYESWSFAEFNGVIDQEIDWLGGGFNYYFRGQDLKLTLEYSQAQFDREVPGSEDFDTLSAQLQVNF